MGIFSRSNPQGVRVADETDLGGGGFRDIPAGITHPHPFPVTAFGPQSGTQSILRQGHDMKMDKRGHHSRPSGDFWSQDEIRVLSDLWERQVPIQAIANQLGRSHRSVAVTAFRTGLKPRTRNGKPIRMSRDPAAGMRACLSCTQLFYSEGKGNRICGYCKNKEGWDTGNDYAFDGEFRDNGW